MGHLCSGLRMVYVCEMLPHLMLLSNMSSFIISISCIFYLQFWCGCCSLSGICLYSLSLLRSCSPTFVCRTSQWSSSGCNIWIGLSRYLLPVLTLSALSTLSFPWHVVENPCQPSIYLYPLFLSSPLISRMSSPSICLGPTLRLRLCLSVSVTKYSCFHFPYFFPWCTWFCFLV